MWRRRESTAYNSTPPPVRQQDKGTPTATTLLNLSRSGAPSCCYCQQKHSSKGCTTVDTTAARKQILKTSGRCFNCLSKGHLSRHCRSAGRCANCKGKHHTSICNTQDETPPTTAQSLVQEKPLNPNAPTFTATANNLCAGKVQSVLLQTARAHIYGASNPRRSIEVRLLLDSGSQRSYLSKRASDSLELQPTGEQQLAIATFGSSRECLQTYPVVEVCMKLKGFSPLCLSLYVTPMICEPLVSQPIASCLTDSQHLASLDLADYSSGEASLEVDMLIGSDFYWDLVTGGVSRGIRGPVAIHTKLGWVLSGPALGDGAAQCSANLVTTHVLHADAQPGVLTTLEDRLRSFWDLESLGIASVEKTLFDEFLNTVSIQNGRYQVSLPWKDFHKPLPDNFQLCLKRLNGLLHRLRHSPDVLQQYHSIIMDQLRQGIVEAVPDTSNSNLCHYLPHHAVVRSDKATTKLRIVYDASAKVVDGPSLNDCLHKGPKFNQLIFDILLRFRTYKYALTADLEKAFLQISVAECDRDVLRFLWVEDVDKDPPNVRTYRFARVVFGVSASPFLLNATLKHHLQQHAAAHSETVRRLPEFTYVDDIVTGANTEDEAFELYSQSKIIFREGGFNLRKFVSNSQQLQYRIDATERQHASRQPSSSKDCLEESYVGSTLGDLGGVQIAHTVFINDHESFGKC